MTTGALYKRFKGKEELFCALVESTVQDLEEVVRQKSVLPATLTDEQLKKAWDMDREYMQWWINYLYDRYDEMRLLLVFSDGTKYANFEHEWVEGMSHTTYAYYKEAQRRGLTKTDISEKEMHVMLSSFWTAICEPLIHGFSKEEAGRISDLMCGLFDWYKMLKSILKYAGKYKILTVVATVMVVIAVAAQILPYIFAYQIISPLIAGESIPWQYAVGRVHIASCIFICSHMRTLYRKNCRQCGRQNLPLETENGETAPRRGAGEGDGESQKAVRGRR